jgi:uncharacterized protein with von Willebrand factor type A (vWA) domain
VPHFEFTRWDGTQAFVPLSAETAFEQLMEHLVEHGDALLRFLERNHDDESDLLKLLVKEGYLERNDQGRLAVSPRGVRRMEEKALHDLFTVERRDAPGKHETLHKGAGQVVHEDVKPYVYGDPVANLCLHETLKNAVARQRGGTPIHVAEEDFVVYQTEFQTTCATVVLLDMSGSMARYGKFGQAKKVVLALQALVRSRFPEDTLQVVGFYTYASPLGGRLLAQATPKPVSLFDSRVFLRVSLDQPPDFVPEHFTNIQAGLRFARDILRRQSVQNKQIICVTDGEPTAHLEGRELVLVYPPSERTATRTLEEVALCTREGIRLSTFALIEDYFYLGLVNFVDRMARVSKGVAAYCTAGELGGYVLDSFTHGRRQRKHVG